jgi:hypothetical protein
MVMMLTIESGRGVTVVQVRETTADLRMGAATSMRRADGLGVDEARGFLSRYEQSESISLAFVTALHGFAEDALLTKPHRLELPVHRDDVRFRPGKRELDLSATGSVASPSAREPQVGGVGRLVVSDRRQL